MVKIYSDDPLVHYQGSTIDPLRTKVEIDALLGYWQVSDVHWHMQHKQSNDGKMHWNPIDNEIYVQFKLTENNDGRPINIGVRVNCPLIWNKAKPRGHPPRLEEINWTMSMRVMYWYIKTSLEMAYAMQSDKFAAFLPNLLSSSGKTVKDIVKDQLERIGQFEALPDKEEEKAFEKVIEVEPTKEE